MSRQVKGAFSYITAATQTWLTIFVTTIYNFVLAWGVVFGSLTFKDYIFAVGPVNTMVMAFWLGSETTRRASDSAQQNQGYNPGRDGYQTGRGGSDCRYTPPPVEEMK